MPELNEYAAKNLTLFQSICTQSNIQSIVSIQQQQQQHQPFSSPSSSSSILTTNEIGNENHHPITSSPSSTTLSSSYNNIASPNSTQPLLDMSQLTINLLDWTNLTDPRHKLETVLLKAKESFDYLDMKWWTQIENEITNIINEGNNKQMREIEGLAKRLSDLNSLLETCKLCLSREKEICDVRVSQL